MGSTNLGNEGKASRLAFWLLFHNSVPTFEAVKACTMLFAVTAHKMPCYVEFVEMVMEGARYPTWYVLFCEAGEVLN